jgi:hypothetical protein
MITFELWVREKNNKKSIWKQLGDGELGKKALETLMYSFKSRSPEFEFKLMEVNRKVINKI